MNKQNRDVRFDIIKAVSITFVFIGHILQFGFEEYTLNPVFNIIWALQIPLFMFVSGYFAVSKTSVTKSLDYKKIVKRAVAYILPFFSYFYIIKVLLLGNFKRDFIKATIYLSTHLESSMWFLFVVFILYLMFTVADYVSNRFKKEFVKFIILILSLLCLMIPWFLIVLKLNSSFLGAKYVIYYSAFFGFGYILRQYKSKFEKIINNNLKNIIFLGCLLIFMGIVLNTQLCLKNDSVINVILRIVAGFAGIIVLGIMCLNITYKKSKVMDTVLKLGENTLQIYFAHMLFLPVFKMTNIPIFSVEGIIVLIVNSSIIGLFTYATIKIIQSNSLTNLIFFGKMKLR